MLDAFISNKRLFSGFIDQLDCPLIFLSSALTVEIANDFAIKLLQLNPDDHEGLDIQIFCREHHYSLSQIFEQESGTPLEETYNTAGRECCILWKIVELNSMGGDLEGSLLIGCDVTQYKSFSRNLNEKIFFYENILSKLPSNVYWKDKHCVYMGCNERFARVMGLPSRNAIKGMTDFDFSWSREAAESFIAFDKKVMQSGISLDTEDVFEEASGKVVTVLTNKTPLKNAAGETVGVLAISVDITEKKQLEKELHDSAIREERLKVLSSMGGMIAHEMRTPLTAISLSVKSINQYFPILLDVYKQWSQEKKTRLIPPFHLKGLTKICDSIIHSLKQADETVNMILNGFKPSQLTEENLGQVSVDELFDALLS